MKSDDPGGQTVLYLWPYLDWGGAQIYFFGLMKWVREGRTVKAIVPAGSAPRLFDYLEGLEVPYELLPAHTGGAVRNWADRIRRRWLKLRCEWAIVRHLSRYDRKRTIVHLDVGPWSSFALLGYLSLRGNVFVTLHTALPDVSTVRFVSWWLKFRVLDRLDGFHLLTSNRDTLESLRPFLPDNSLRRVTVAYSGIDRDEIRQALAAPLDRAAWCERFGLPSDALFVFCLGQFIERKGCGILLEAARELRTEDPRLFFVWVGTGELEADRKELIAASGAANRFRYISGNELGAGRMALLTLLRLADIYVLPSFQEGLPIALLEAMALGIPCIASDVNSIPEAVRDGQTGLLVPPGDGGALAEVIAELAGDGSLRQRLGAAGQELVFSQFDERVSAEATMANYEKCWS